MPKQYTLEDLDKLPADVRDKAIKLLNGIAEEDRRFGMVNKTSAAENCETSAIGRALSNLGLQGGEYPSGDELLIALEQQKKKIPVDKEKLSSKDMFLSEHSYEFDTYRSEWGGIVIRRHTPWNIKKYTAPDDGYNAYHCDWTTHDNMVRRVVSSILYLNDVEEGGETEFYFQGFKIKPKKGRLILFPTFYTHLHKGHKPISNDKYVAMCWNTTTGGIIRD